jgi:hypothetical protein
MAEYEGHNASSAKATIAKLTRSIAQDQGRIFKKDVLGRLYPKKEVNKIDIGKICEDWTYVVLTNLAYDNQLLNRLLIMIHIAYERGQNLNTKRSWLMYMRVKGVIPFSMKINEMTDIAMLSFMGQLEKPKKSRTRYEDENW